MVHNSYNFINGSKQKLLQSYRTIFYAFHIKDVFWIASQARKVPLTIYSKLMQGVKHVVGGI